MIFCHIFELDFLEIFLLKKTNPVKTMIIPKIFRLFQLMNNSDDKTFSKKQFCVKNSQHASCCQCYKSLPLMAGQNKLACLYLVKIF